MPPDHGVLPTFRPDTTCFQERVAASAVVSLPATQTRNAGRPRRLVTRRAAATLGGCGGAPRDGVPPDHGNYPPEHDLPPGHNESPVHDKPPGHGEPPGYGDSRRAARPQHVKRGSGAAV